MEPTLDTLDPKLPGVQALRTFSAHIQELSELENSLSEPYEMQEENISAFCENVMNKNTRQSTGRCIPHCQCSQTEHKD